MQKSLTCGVEMSTRARARRCTKDQENDAEDERRGKITRE
jgi:hypothetical protein